MFESSTFTRRTTLAIIAIAVLVLSFHGPYFGARPAFASASIVPSSDHWFGPGLARIMITDSSKNSAGASIPVHVDVKRGSITLASADPAITSPGTSGTFEIYFTTSNAPFAPAFPTNPNDYAVGRINASPHTQLRDFSLTLPPGDYLRDGDSVTVSYAGQSQTIQFSRSTVAASVDRTTAGDGNRIVLTLTDQSANVDPTAVDSFTADTSVLSVTGGTMNFTGARFVESGQNTGSFQLVITVTSSSTAASPPGGATLAGVQFPTSAQFTVRGFDVYADIPPGATAPYASVTPNPGATSSQSVLLSNSDATITIGNSSAPSSGGVLLTAKAVPAIIRAGDSFWINATVANNSPNTIQYSRMCAPFFSVSFDSKSVVQAGRACNIMAILEHLNPGQSTTVRIPGFADQHFESNQTGTVNATVQFQYQVAGQPYATGNVSQSLLIPILPKNPGIGESFSLGYNQTVVVKPANLGITFVNVTEDSRCPQDVQCVWAGRAAVQLKLVQYPAGRTLGLFNLTSNGNQSALAHGLAVSLQNVQPAPSKAKLQPSDYVITLVVTPTNATRSIDVTAPSVTAKGGGKTGDAFRLASSVSSRFDGVQTYVAVFEVRSVDTGVTDFIGLVNGTVSGNQTLIVAPPSSWIPSAPGAYEVRAFVLDSIDVPSVVSGVSVSQLILKA